MTACSSTVSGAGDFHIIVKHVLPNCLGPLIVQLTFIFAYAILAEAGLSFLGVGVPPDIPTWGTMIAGSLEYADIVTHYLNKPGFTRPLASSRSMASAASGASPCRRRG